MLYCKWNSSPNICKGEYKLCSKCNEVKLTNKFNKNGKQGLMPMCKKCR
nr:MAG TPA: restriction endonuclease [Caudoviricetes sp.]